MSARPSESAPFVVWFTGLSGAGKSTLALRVEAELRARGLPAFHLDGDELRQGLNRDLGYDDDARVESIRRIAEVTRLLYRAGHVVLVAAISPFAAGRAEARQLVAPGAFVEVFVDAPLAVAEQRDPKGLYQRARAGQLAHFTGIDAPYEAPEHPEIRVDTARLGPDEAAAAVVAHLVARGLATASAGLS